MASAARGAISSAGSSLGNAAATIGGIGVIAGVADVAEGDGLDKAEAAAGQVLRPLFGGQVPWEMSASEIVDAVVPNFLPDVIPGAASDAVPATVVPLMTDFLTMVV